MRPPGESLMKVLMTKGFLATRSNAYRSCLGAWNLLDPGLPLSQQYPGILANEVVAKNFFDFTYFHGPSVARPHGRRLLTRNGKVRKVPSWMRTIRNTYGLAELTTQSHSR